MKNRMYAIAVLIALALVANLPNVSMAAQNSQSSQVPIMRIDATGPQAQATGQPSTAATSVNQGQAAAGGSQVPQPKGGVATVVGVDQPENCLRIRSGPGNAYDVIGCANMGDQLNITGVWASNNWAQLADNGWVYGPQIQTDLRPPGTAYSQGRSYVVTEPVTPDYSDWGYLPDWGYDTYWYGGIPIYLYNVAIWYRYHPWWWHRGHQAWWWQNGHHGRRAWNAAQFRSWAGPRGGTVTNRANISPSNVSRFNANRLGAGSTRAFRARTYSSPYRIRSGSVNAFRAQSFSSPRTFRSGGSFGGGRFSGAARFGGGRIGGGHFGGGGGGRHR